MKQRLVRVPVLSAIVGGLMLVSQGAPARAQTLETRISSIEFKDASLRWALEMLFKADNTPSYSIDPLAEEVPIGALTLQNITVRNAMNQLLNQNNFKLSRGVNGIYVVEPREPPASELGGESTFPGNPRGGGSDRNVPGNPFGAFGGVPATRGGVPATRGGDPRSRNQINRQILPALRTQSNSQTRPFGGGAADDTTPPPPQLIQIKHIYAGGIALLFGGSVLPTLPFVAPASGSNNFGGNNQQGGQGGFGGQQGGFGGQQGGFGGQQGGFGGQQGGFGGQQGGFGGGFGGQQGGFGGQQGGFGGQQGGFGGGGGGFGF